MPTTRRVINGVRHKLCGGYVSWDGRGNDQHGFPIRRRKELRVWIPSDLDVSDCGSGTDTLVTALKARAKDRKNVEVSECWEY